MPDQPKKQILRRFKNVLSRQTGKVAGEPQDGSEAQCSPSESENGNDTFRQKLVTIIVQAVSNISKESDRDEIIRWFVHARSIVEEGGTKKEIAKALYDHVDSKRTFQLLWSSVATSLKNYKDSDLPLSLKVALPVAAAGVVALGTAGGGLAMFGGAIGLPVVVILFLGTAGLTSVVEAFTKNKNVRDPLTIAVLALVSLETKRRLDKAVLGMLREELQTPSRAEVPEEEKQLRLALLEMDSGDFERHVMSFFEADRLPCGVSHKGRDKGIDGWAEHPEGFIVVQCKRYGEDHPVGRPVIQQLKGVVEETRAFRAYLVTTSRFTKEAQESGEQSHKIMMVDMDGLVAWHSGGRRTWEREQMENNL